MFLAISLSAAKGYYAYSPLAREAYELATSLRLQEAGVAIARLKKAEPDNLIAYHVENYLDFFTIYIGQNKSDFERLKANKDRRLARLAEGDARSPWHKYVQADVRLQWALARLVFEEYVTAFTEVNKAFKLLRDNQERFPDFIPNYKNLGILHAVAGTIPDEYKWGVSIISSLRGDLAQGRGEIERVLEYSRRHDFIFATETRVIYAFLLLHLGNDSESAWKTLQDKSMTPATNPLHCFIMANIAMHADKNDRAIALLSKKPSGAQFHSFPYLDFMLGLCKLRRLDEGADRYMKRYISQFRGQHYIKEAYQKLAWHELVNGNAEGYRSYMKACIRQGAKASGADGSALKEAMAGVLPHVTLLKARLLFDGGYYERANKLLAEVPAASLTEQRDQLEYSYRMGRVMEALKRYEEALGYYERTIKAGEQHKLSFACKSALQSGKIYETTKRPAEAAAAYKRCLSISPDEYKTGLHQQAKAGLARLKKG